VSYLSMTASPGSDGLRGGGDFFLADPPAPPPARHAPPDFPAMRAQVGISTPSAPPPTPPPGPPSSPVRQKEILAIPSRVGGPEERFTATVLHRDWSLNAPESRAIPDSLLFALGKFPGERVVAGAAKSRGGDFAVARDTEDRTEPAVP
jgi:hypothetical protein